MLSAVVRSTGSCMMTLTASLRTPVELFSSGFDRKTCLMRVKSYSWFSRSPLGWLSSILGSIFSFVIPNFFKKYSESHNLACMRLFSAMIAF